MLFKRIFFYKCLKTTKIWFYVSGLCANGKDIFKTKFFKTHHKQIQKLFCWTFTLQQLQLKWQVLQYQYWYYHITDQVPSSSEYFVNYSKYLNQSCLLFWMTDPADYYEKKVHSESQLFWAADVLVKNQSRGVNTQNKAHGGGKSGGSWRSAQVNAQQTYL